jgi:hypothetical protein
MRPVKQDRLYSPEGISNGNCFAACLASLLDLKLWMVPPFEDMFGRDEWRNRVKEWLGKMFKMDIIYYDHHKTENMPEFYIASGKSKRGVYHSVIYSNGVLVHDPHPSNDGIDSVEWVYVLEPTNES